MTRNSCERKQDDEKQIRPRFQHLIVPDPICVLNYFSFIFKARIKDRGSDDSCYLIKTERIRREFCF